MNEHRRVTFEVFSQANEAYASSDFEAARAGFEYVRAALGDEGRTELREGAKRVWLSGVLNSLLACAQPLQDWAAMKEVATDLIALEPNDCDAWIRLSIGLKHLGELTPATEAVLRAIELDADDSNARYEHACQLAVAGDLEAAIDRVAEALDRGARRAEMQADDELSALHGLPRWQTLMRTRH